MNERTCDEPDSGDQFETTVHVGACAACRLNPETDRFREVDEKKPWRWPGPKPLPYWAF